MQTDKKQLSIVIALSLILVLAVVYSVTKSMGRTKAATGTAAAPSTAQTTSGSAPGETSATDPTDPDAVEYRFVGNPPIDPFEPRLVGASSAEPLNRVEQQRPAQQRKNTRVAWNLGQSGSLPPWRPAGGIMDNLRVQPPSEGTAGAGTPSAQAEPEKPPYRMTGVIKGGHSMAILRGEAGGRYFVRQGQTLADGYTVSTITSGGVVLKNNNRRIFLKLGGAQDATTTDRSR